MSQFCLSDPNDNVLEERIEWNTISHRALFFICIHITTYKVTSKYDTIQNEPKEAMQSSFNRIPHLQGNLNEINREQNMNAK